MSDPRLLLKRWLPHVVLWGLMALVVGLLLALLAPIAKALLLAIALAVLAYPVAYAPSHAALAARFPDADDALIRYISALAVVVAVCVVLGGGAVLVLWVITGSVRETLHALVGVATHDPDAVHRLVDLIMGQIQGLLATCPGLPIDPATVRRLLEEQLERTAVGPAVFSLLLTGTSSLIAQAALTLVTLFYLCSEGTWLMRRLLSSLPLTPPQRDWLRGRFRTTAVHLLIHTGGQAIVQGIALGLIAWAIGGFNPVLIALLAALIALLPVVGPTVAWLPIASALWTTAPDKAILLGGASLLSTLVIAWGCRRLAVAMGTDGLWLSFLLFLGLIGGVLSYGLTGLVLGPAVVLTVTVLWGVLPLMYGVGDEGA
jgi:predicted PurR-regulated permease PerM